MASHKPGVGDRQVGLDIALGITLRHCAARSIRTIKQEGDSRVGGEVLAADMERCAGRAGRSLSDMILANDADHWLWQGKEMVDEKTTTRTQDDDDSQHHEQEARPPTRP